MNTLTSQVGDGLLQDDELNPHLVEGLHELEGLGLSPSMILNKVGGHGARLLTLPKLVCLVLHLSLQGLL